MTSEILDLARQLGGLSGEEEILRPLCQAAQAELARRLRSGILPEDCDGVFPLAAACLVLAALCAAGRLEQAVSFTAGDVTIRQDSGSATDRAAALREQAVRLIAPWAQDTGFCFQKVMG